MNRKKYVIIAVIVAAAVLLSILLYTRLSNHPPVIAGLEVKSDRIFPSGSAQIVCNATDPDGDELRYEWWASKGEIDGEGDTITWTAPDDEGLYNVGVTVTDGRGGEDTKSVTINVKANEPPEITSLTADTVWTLPSGSLHVSCNASDPDGDELSYEWSTTGGKITGTEAEVTWTAPEEVGSYNITVVVDDGYGGSATRTLPVSVVTGQPPVVEDLLITKDRYKHCYLMPYARGYRVGQGKKYDIECIASHPDNSELSYEWDCDDGEIEGEGAMITWTAPNKSDIVTVTVRVSDVAGNMAPKSITLYVVSCTACITWPPC